MEKIDFLYNKLYAQERRKTEAFKIHKKIFLSLIGEEKKFVKTKILNSIL